MQYPSQMEIAPLTRPPHAVITVPGSKSITNRALVLAALTASTETPTVLDGALQSEDTEIMIDCLGKLGVEVTPDWPNARIAVRQTGSMLQNGADLFVGNSGTTMRFLTAMVSLGHGRFRLDGVPRMRERPIHDLLDALKQLGVRAYSESDNGCPPVIVEADGLRGGAVRIKGDTSSQFVSGLMMAAPFANSDITIDVEGALVSAPYVNMTIEMLREFNLRAYSNVAGRYWIHHTGPAGHYLVRAPRYPEPLASYRIEPDASAASYFFGAAAITGGRIVVPGSWQGSMQGDARFLDALTQMGCDVWYGHADERAYVAVTGGALHGIDIDMNAISDTVMTLAAVACFAHGPTTIRNVAHIRHKETDRLAALATELRRVGAHVDEHADGLTITPALLHGATIQTYNDHRMAMSMALVGLRVPGIVIDNPACVAKTYPRFFEDLERLR
jgi:3-phosphoshikimate 1-carboxyvinyltransferase